MPLFELFEDFLLSQRARAFIMLQASPLETVDDLFRRAFYFPILVSVLDSKDELAVVDFGVEVVVQGSSQSTDVKVTSRRRSESDSYFADCLIITNIHRFSDLSSFL